MPDKAGAEAARAGLSRDLRRIRRGEKAERAGRALQPVRCALLPDALPAAQQHPRLAASDRRGAAPGSLRAEPGDQHLPRDLRPDLPAGPAVRRQLRDRAGRATAPSRSARWRNTSPTPRGRKAGSSRSARAGTRESVGIIGAGPAGWPRPTCCAGPGVQVTVYDRYDRGRRADDLWHPRLQAGEGRGDAPDRQLEDGRRRPSAELRRGRGYQLRRDPQQTRRGADRHRGLQVARIAGPGVGAARHRAGDRLT